MRDSDLFKMVPATPTGVVASRARLGAKTKTTT